MPEELACLRYWPVVNLPAYSLPNMPLPATDAVDQQPPRLTAKQFAELYAAAHARLWGLAAALVGDRSEAEDLVQEAALVGLRKLDEFIPESNFVAWMAKIVRMHALNWRRKHAGRRTSAADPVDIDQSQAAPRAPAGAPAIADAAAGQVHAIQESFDDVLLRGLQGLEETPRACLLLRIVHELSYDEIAAMLEIPAGTAMSHVHRAKRRLRDDLSSQVATETSQP